MKKTKVLIALFIFLFTFLGCNKNSSKVHDSDFSLFKEYISSFSGAIVSSQSDIRVVLAFDKKEWKANQILDNDLFDISPNIDGKVIALSSNTVAFIPKDKLESDTEYQISFHLSKLIAVKKELSTFKFSLKTIKQDFIVETQDIQSYNNDFQYLNGSFKSADNIDLETVKKIIAATQNNKKLNIKFDKTENSSTEFNFIIDSIQRFSQESNLEIDYDGSRFNIDQKGKIDFPIAAKNDFKVTKVEIPKGDIQTLHINFSELLQKGQDFSGLIAIQNTNNLKFVVQGNLLKVFFNDNTSSTTTKNSAIAADDFENEVPNLEISGALLVEVFQGIESEGGQKTISNYSTKVSFEQVKPAVRFIKNGTILPSSNNLKINFEAVNLRAVDVKVYKIYKNNILQFLQDNDLNGTQYLKRVAQPIAKQTINLKANKLLDFGSWNSFALDLSTLITPEPGAIYRIEFSFKKAHSLYKCESQAAEKNQEEDEVVDENDVNYSGGNYYDDDYYDADYDWREHEDPCSKSYYYNTKIGTNVLASDLGVVVKRGENKSYFIAVNNIVTTEPVANATVDLYSFQQQKIASLATNKDGIATIQSNKFAYFAIVTLKNQSTYVKLDDGNSLSVSNFDVAGASLQKGIKGYIYGERGVWRPGDKLYLSFILNDNANKLPKEHPIKFRLSDPSGKVVFQSVQKSNTWNHYLFVVSTNADAPTGNWEAMFNVGGAKFYKNIKIETIKPNRLKIKNVFKNELLSSSYLNTSSLEVTWLHGAVAKNLKTEIQAKFTQQTTVFKNYSNYTFDDLVRKFNTEENTIFSGKTDVNGRASVSIQPKLQGQAPGMLKASFITKVYEEGGDFSTDVFSTTFSPYKTYVGIKAPLLNKYGMLETRKTNRFDIITLDEKGNPKAVKNLEIKIYKIEWRWWWDASNDNLSNYNAAEATTAFKTLTLSTGANGKGSIQFALTDDEWGRYLIRVSDEIEGHATAVTVNIDWSTWSGKSKNTTATTANMLVFSSDKTKYSVGEKAQISFPSSKGGRALIAVENGSKIVQTLWVSTQSGETKFELPILTTMAPNVYINITLLQPHSSTINDSPIRMYGIIPIEVIDKNTILEPKLLMPDVLKPEQLLNIKVSEKRGKSMTYTIAIVDEGLLDLTRFKTPNAWDAFYVREALGVKTWDVYDHVIGAYGGKVNQIFSIGGDQDLGGGKAKKANRFKPAIIYLGPFRLEKGQSKTHQIRFPKYIGSVKTMIVASDANSNAYGSAEKITPVRSPLMVLASLPRKISPSEKVTIPVTVFAMEKNIKKVTLQIKVNKGLKIIGSALQNLSFEQPDEKMAYFNLQVGNATGIGKIQIIATSGAVKTSYEVEIDKTNPNPITNTFSDVVLNPSSSKTISWKTFGVAGSNKAMLEVSSMPTIDFNRRLQYLIEYPHGCVEQTTSAVFPQLFLNDVADIDANRQQNIQKNVTIGIARLSSFQLPNGGFSYWQGQPTADDWGSSYAGHFLIEAEKKGYVLPINFKSKWISFQQKEAKQWRFAMQYGNDFAQAYRLYTLALAGSPDLSSMNRLRETLGISNESKLRLATAYVLAGQKEAGLTLLAKSKIDEVDSKYNDYYYGSSQRNRAMTLETLILLGQKQNAFLMATKIANQMSSNEWMSTQTTAFCLYSMSKFAKINGTKGIDVLYSGNGKSYSVKTNKSIAERSLIVKMGANGITIKNNKDNTLFVRLLNTGILPIGQEKMVQNNLSATIVFKNRKGAIINVSKIKQSTEFIAVVTITNRKNEKVEHLALSQILPSGFEIVNSRFTDYGDATNNIADYIDIRDDRTNFYFGLKANETKTFRILMNASYLGNYYLPELQCEAMYDNTFLARTKGFWVEVIK